MDKQQTISFIERQLATGAISKADLLNLTNSVVHNNNENNEKATLPEKSSEESSRSLINTFYGIGAIIAVVGVGILVGEHWQEIGFTGRISVTLGISLVTYIAALLLNRPQQKTVSQVMFTIAAVLAPFGSYILLNQAGMSFDWTSQIITSLVLFVIFGTAFFISKKNILVLITVGFATWTYCAFILKTVAEYGYSDTDLLKWAAMLLGASYLCIAYGYGSSSKKFGRTDGSDTEEKWSIQNILYGLGTVAVLGAGISIGGVFDLVFIALIFAAFYGSVYLKSRAMLIFGALFLMAHIIKLTSKYFVGSVGWPVALIVIGFLVIGVGYVTYYLNKRFISEKRSGVAA